MVVFIVTCLVPFPAEFVAWSATCLALKCGIQALTIFTVQVCCLPATAVTAVPVTATVVIAVITVSVSLPLPDFATPITVIGHSRVQAQTLFAVIILVSLRAVSTAITAVPVATAYIVVVVTMPISLPWMDRAIFFAFGIVNVFFIHAGAGVTVAVIVFEAATVTAIPVASTVVITVVTYFVTNPCQNFAWLAAFHFCLIQACALIAVRERLRGQLFVGFCTTVAAIPITTTFVVAIVAVPVTFPGIDITPWHARMVACEIGVVARTVRTVVVIIFVATAVATIPTATTIVVFVIAIAVASEMIHCTGAVTIYERISARTVFTIFVSFVCTATVAIVPATLANIISVVTIFVTLPYFDTRCVGTFEYFAIFRCFFLVSEAPAFAAITLKQCLKRLTSVICHAVKLIAGVTKA